MSERKLKVYHYTDRNGKEAIERTGHIQPSSNGAYGPGVYLTTMAPEQGRKAISRNNWQALDSTGRADYAFELEIPASQLQDKRSHDRDILIHRGPVQLGGHRWRAVQN